MINVKPINKRKLTLNDKYKEFLNKGAKPKDSFSNPLNIFDDLNQKDRVWLRNTKRYLSRRSSLRI